MSDDLPKEVTDWIDQVRYEEDTEFPVEMGYVWTTCASVENGNPLFWDEKVASEITGGSIAPPTMLSVWFRPHFWAPGRAKQSQPLQVHGWIDGVDEKPSERSQVAGAHPYLAKPLR